MTFDLEKKLKYIRLKHFAGLVLFIIVFTVKDIFISNGDRMTYILIAVYIALFGGLAAFFSGKTYYIYDFSIVDEDVEIQLVNMYGKTKTVDFTISELHEIELKEKNFWRAYEFLRMHIRYSIKKVAVIKCGLGKQIIQELKPRIKQQ